MDVFGPLLFKPLRSILPQTGRAFFRRFINANAVTHMGVKLVIDRKKMSKQVCHIIYKGLYECNEGSIIQSTIHPHDRILELGGGIGFTAIKAALKLATPSQLLVVEANPDLIPLIHANAKTNGLTLNVLNCALGIGDGVRSFYQKRSFLDGSCIPDEMSKVVQVPQKDAQTLIDSFQPNYLVLDIEGSEVELLPALNLDRIQKICVETHTPQVGERPTSLMIAHLIKEGFNLDMAHSVKNSLFFTKELSP